MSIFVYILIYIGLAGIKYLFDKMTEDKRERSAGNELKEVFPTLSESCDEYTNSQNYVPEENNAVMPISDIPTIEEKNKSPLFVTPQSNDTIADTAIDEKNKAIEKETTHQKTRKIALTTREEARRAFIYAEIFNRKYE